MRICNLGSLNFDKVYDLTHFVAAAETVLADGYGEFLGGKGLNQSVALARAGAQVWHMGAVGADGAALRQCLVDSGVDVTYLQQLDGVSGHAIIQSVNGQNNIIVFGGANGQIQEDYINKTLQNFDKGDLLLLQNEVSNVPAAIRTAKEKKMLVAFNASPINDALLTYPLELVDIFLINEVEAKALACTEESDFPQILQALQKRFPDAKIVMTVGAAGVYYADKEQTLFHPSYAVKAVDSTAAGDTFTGFFLAALAKQLPIETCLEQASKAGALAVSKKGATPSIPTADEVAAFNGTPKA